VALRIWVDDVPSPRRARLPLGAGCPSSRIARVG
jgi:hypothetical protein